VVGALLARGLIREQITDSPRKADAALNTIWRNLPEPDGRGVLLFITPAGLEAIGVEPEAVPYAFNEGTNAADEPPRARPRAPTRRRSSPRRSAGPAAQGGAHGRGRARRACAEDPRRHQAGAGDRHAPAPRGRDHRPDRRGHRLEVHTVRGFFAGALKKKLGLEVTSEKVEAAANEAAQPSVDGSRRRRAS
jgi:hypothetical protein